MSPVGPSPAARPAGTAPRPPGPRAPLAAALAALAAAACSAGSPDFAVRPVPPGPAPAPFAAAFRAAHVGDMGEYGAQQAEVSRALAAEARARPLDLVVHAGDNLYECGPDAARPGADACAFAADGSTVERPGSGPEDPRFAWNLERALEPVRRDGRPVPVLLVLGNHDVAAWGSCARGGDPAAVARTKACLEVARVSPQWSMPGRHWVVDRGPVRLIGIDSNLLKRDYGGFTFEGEEAFVREVAAPCAERLCFLVSHHPSASAGEHRGDATPAYLERVRRLEAAAGGRIAAWLSGHEHQLEHLRSPSGTEVFISGNAARGRPQERFSAVSVPGTRLLFASTAWGFGVLEVGDGAWSYRFVNSRGEAIHCCAAAGRAPCEPVACAP